MEGHNNTCTISEIIYFKHIQDLLLDETAFQMNTGLPRRGIGMGKGIKKGKWVIKVVTEIPWGWEEKGGPCFSGMGMLEEGSMGCY